ncbi:hypothetical protein RSAG8_10731, partial [Rhizoctonia solani AG-8 WAC10335]
MSRIQVPDISHSPDDNDTFDKCTLSERIRSPHDNRQPIDKLPGELLAYIFIVTEELTRSIAKRNESRYTPFQDIAVQVSSRWRQAAIASPALWTYIRITNARSRDITDLWISRAADWKGQEEHATSMFECLSHHGAGPQRWRSLSFSALQPEPIYRLIRLLNQKPAPKLQQLYLYVNHLLGPESDSGRGWTEALYSLDHAMPNLAHVEFGRVSWKYVFDRPKPLLSGTSHTLKLLGGFEFPASLPKLHQLLSANPSLELLELNIGATPPHTLNPLRGDRPLNPAHLPSLRTLSLGWDFDITWGWGITSIIRAPLLESLSLAGCDFSQGQIASAAFFDYVITGQFPGDNSPINTPTNNPLFPSLRKLDVSDVFLVNTNKAIDMVASFPFITRLSISCSVAPQALSGLQHSLPRLDALSLFCRGNGLHKCLQKCSEPVSLREQNGYPVRVEHIVVSPMYGVRAV